jgi:hypothetical protein
VTLRGKPGRLEEEVPPDVRDRCADDVDSIVLTLEIGFASAPVLASSRTLDDSSSLEELSPGFRNIDMLQESFV